MPAKPNNRPYTRFIAVFPHAADPAKWAMMPPGAKTGDHANFSVPLKGPVFCSFVGPVEIRTMNAAIFMGLGAASHARDP
jgi:hypothetical protein